MRITHRKRIPRLAGSNLGRCAARDAAAKRQGGDTPPILGFALAGAMWCSDVRTVAKQIDHGERSLPRLDTTARCI